MDRTEPQPQRSTLVLLRSAVILWNSSLRLGARGRDDNPLLLKGKKLVLNWFEWNIPPHATHWLATCWSDAAAHWSDQILDKIRSWLSVLGCGPRLRPAAPVAKFRKCMGNIFGKYRRICREFPGVVETFLRPIDNDFYLCKTWKRKFFTPSL